VAFGPIPAADEKDTADISYWADASTPLRFGTRLIAENSA
jgi:hypothetical protein